MRAADSDTPTMAVVERVGRSVPSGRRRSLLGGGTGGNEQLTAIVGSVLLVLFGMVALVWELKSPGHGVGYIVFAFCLGLFFWLQVFAGSAGLMEILLFGLGAAIIAVEVFILPTFGAGLFVGSGVVIKILE